MEVVRTIAQLQAALRSFRAQHGPGARIGFVPTMGYLHAGHASLLDRARAACTMVVLSIFVNPLQFGAGEDLTIYPRDEVRDLQIAQEHAVDLVFIPEVAEMYPYGRDSLTTVHVRHVTDRLCGAARPGHFTGVATVVSKLFHLVQPDQAFFGMKDAQQVAVIQQMTNDLHFPVEIVPCPTVREPDGLALSSRNVYLSDEQRRAAPVIWRTLSALDEWLLTHPQATFAALEQAVITQLAAVPFAQPEYAECLRFPDFAPVADRAVSALTTEPLQVLVAVAVRFGKTRLIDNRLLGGGGHRV
jgi:pantoate--beta-alanine ligase